MSRGLDLIFGVEVKKRHETITAGFDKNPEGAYRLKGLKNAVFDLEQVNTISVSTRVRIDCQSTVRPTRFCALLTAL